MTQRKALVIFVIAADDDVHCDDECPMLLDGPYCRAFDLSLDQDAMGQLRCRDCVKSEVK